MYKENSINIDTVIKVCAFLRNNRGYLKIFCQKTFTIIKNVYLARILHEE